MRLYSSAAASVGRKSLRGHPQNRPGNNHANLAGRGGRFRKTKKWCRPPGVLILVITTYRCRVAHFCFHFHFQILSRGRRKLFGFQGLLKSGVCMKISPIRRCSRRVTSAAPPTFHSLLLQETNTCLSRSTSLTNIGRRPGRRDVRVQKWLRPKTRN